MDAKLDCEVDAEGAVRAVDMMVREKEGASISRRPCLRLYTAHSPRASRQPPNELMNARACGHSYVARMTRSFPNQFPVYFFTAVQRPQPASEQRSDIPRLTRAHILQPCLTQLRVPTVAVIHPGFIFVHQSSIRAQGGTDDLEYARRDVLLNITFGTWLLTLSRCHFVRWNSPCRSSQTE
jgi:hypothetical protein